MKMSSSYWPWFVFVSVRVRVCMFVRMPTICVMMGKQAEYLSIHSFCDASQIVACTLIRTVFAMWSTLQENMEWRKTVSVECFYVQYIWMLLNWMQFIGNLHLILGINVVRWHKCVFELVEKFKTKDLVD